MHETLRKAIDDLYALAKGANKEDAERIHEIIERLRTFSQHDEQQTKTMKLSDCGSHP